MAVTVKSTKNKVVLKCGSDGSQTVSGILGSATNEQIFNTGVAVSQLMAPEIESIQKVTENELEGEPDGE